MSLGSLTTHASLNHIQRTEDGERNLTARNMHGGSHPWRGGGDLNPISSSFVREGKGSEALFSSLRVNAKKP